MRNSPFIKTESKQNVHYLVKSSKKIALKSQEKFTDLFPNASSVPHSIRFYVATIYVTIMIACFVALVLTGYYSALRTKFLSPYSGGEPNKNCELLPVTYSGRYLLSQGGYWEGESKFDYSMATFELSIIALSMSREMYRDVVSDLLAGFSLYGSIAAQQDLGANLMMWMTLNFVDYSQAAQRVTLVGTPLTVFNRDNNDGAVSSVLGNCNLTSTTSFDTNSGVTTISYNYKEYMASPLCVKAMDPAFFGYNTLTRPDHFTIKYDIRTLISCLAVNMQMVDLNTFIELTSARVETEVDGMLLVVQFFYDPKYIGMAPISCITSFGKPLCAVQLGEAYAYPIFNHLGTNTTVPKLCDCSELTFNETDDRNHNCNLFRFVSGFMFLNTPAGTDYLLQVIAKYNSTTDLNRAAHAAMFTASSFGQFSPARDSLTSPENLDKVYDFCRVGNATCSLLVVTTYDNVQQNSAISANFFQLEKGACRDTISPDPAQWERLYAHPYATLNQNYQQCTSDPLQTLTNQAGIAIGNIQIIGPILIVLLLASAGCYRYTNSNVSHDEAYSKNEKDAALEAYAMALLLARDEKLKTAASLRDLGRHSLIEEIVEELSEHTMMSDASFKGKREASPRHSAASGRVRSFPRILGSSRSKVSSVSDSSMAVSSPQGERHFSFRGVSGDSHTGGDGDVQSGKGRLNETTGEFEVAGEAERDLESGMVTDLD